MTESINQQVSNTPSVRNVDEWWSERKRAFEEKVAASGKCHFCGTRPPTEKAGYTVPVYCRPCDRLLDCL